ncbi:hypothetical protein [Microbacterium sp. p3-SID336]|uniref:hypothetical protein n=1 Tax=Microbacterium sp. p3-SID336 TaxID=2916212 RepID=UPI0021A62F85|nr:hypothetical protein [Microbacterium sp. p3-SID336]MCT1479086.1 hypothetical protein [Microbacterium sp. p3-SID336]
MSQSEQPIDEIKPDADLQEQERPEVETPDDPELLVPPVPEAHPIEADPVDAAEQRREVPLDDDRDTELPDDGYDAIIGDDAAAPDAEEQ